MSYLDDIIKRREYNTKTISIKGKKYCCYCGNEIQHNRVVGSYHNNIPDDDYYFCDCDMAIKQIELEDAISNLQSALSDLLYKGDKVTKKKFRKMEYENELEMLNEKYKDVIREQK